LAVAFPRAKAAASCLANRRGDKALILQGPFLQFFWRFKKAREGGNFLDFSRIFFVFLLSRIGL